MNEQFTPEQKIKQLILMRAVDWDQVHLAEPITAENVDSLYNANNPESWELNDAKNEVRCGEVETEIEAEYSRHYESKSVAAMAADGSWVGWTYWYGGGKHGEPEAIDWMDEAYDLECKEEEKMVVVRTFTKPEAA
jgi:hypothetical protein